MSTSRNTTRMTTQLGSRPASPSVTNMLTSSVLSAIGSSSAPSAERWSKRLAMKPSTASDRPAATNSQNAAVISSSSTSQIAIGTESSRPSVMRFGNVHRQSLEGGLPARHRGARSTQSGSLPLETRGRAAPAPGGAAPDRHNNGLRPAPGCGRAPRARCARSRECRRAGRAPRASFADRPSGTRTVMVPVWLKSSMFASFHASSSCWRRAGDRAREQVPVALARCRDIGFGPALGRQRRAGREARAADRERVGRDAAVERGARRPAHRRRHSARRSPGARHRRP